MPWQEYASPIGYSPLAQIIVSFVIGLILSYFSTALAIVVFFLVLYEAGIYAVMAGYDYKRWYFMARVGVIFGYIAGWLIARALLDIDSFYMGEKKDQRLGVRMCTSRH